MNRRSEPARAVTTARPGERPEVSQSGPQTQLSQQAPAALWGKLVAAVFSWPDVFEGHSSVSPASSRAIFFRDELEPPREEATLAPGHRFEPVHIHGVHDTSAHVVLAPDRGAKLTELGWAEPHQYADYGTEFMVYGPRDDAELETVLAIIDESLSWALQGREDS